MNVFALIEVWDEQPGAFQAKHSKTQVDISGIQKSHAINDLKLEVKSKRYLAESGRFRRNLKTKLESLEWLVRLVGSLDGKVSIQSWDSSAGMS